MFDDRLKKLREARGLGQKEVCDMLNLKLRTYSSYENNEREPNSEVLVSLAKFFGVTIDYLLGVDKLRARQTYSNDPDDNDHIYKYLSLSEDSKSVVNCVIDYAIKVDQAIPKSNKVFRAAKSKDNHPPEITELDVDLSKLPVTDENF